MAAEDELSPASTPSSGAPEQHERDARPARLPPRKRRRLIISCTECHRRKQKCDRSLPCANCASRNKQDACRYEAGAPAAKGVQKTQGDDRLARSGSHLGDPRFKAEGAAGPGMADKLTNFGYSTTGSSSSTLGFLSKIDGNNAEESSLSSMALGRESSGEHLGMRERYKSVIRHLPARSYTEKLVDVYFKDFNWQYNAVDQWLFNKQMAEWYSLPFSVLNTEGPQALPPDLRAFPALVFQMIATALLNLPPGPDTLFDSLKYAGSMTFEDLALDYSESGVAIISMLGKRHVSHTAVVAGFVRAAFLKYSGLVTEAWHAIGSAIRDGQECGLHRTTLDPKPKSDKLEDVLENEWEIQRRRKTWIILMSWDVHTAIVLGRPTSIDTSTRYALPLDAPIPKDPSKVPVTLRSDQDPPSPLTRTLWVYRTTMALRDIIELEKDGPCPKDFHQVDEVHESLERLEAETPAFFRTKNPDTRWDDLPECFWVPLVRGTVPLLSTFNKMALHRPYVFTRPHSRKEALKASLDMLNAQRDHFATIGPKYYKAFTLFFGTFDAVVLMASIFILFPRENVEYVSMALQHFQWAMERFETMSERNKLAAAARNVLKAVYTRLKSALKGIQKTEGLSLEHPAEQSATSATKSETMPPFSTMTGGGDNSKTSLLTPAASTASGSSGDPFGSVSGPAGATPIDPGLSGVAASDWTLPEGFHWGSIQPVYAMADIAYNDLMGISSNVGETTSSLPNWAGGTPLLNEVPDEGESQPWLFGGDFGNDSVWNLLNQYPSPF
ncbi:fungal specific transcription factor domain-containing protein [Diaporthe helianthi]|uniref:Fungal specific transcription factor domain-containing protein n=1 Tax=Diaporthe helianthi TaxID=158607 RepID=A0A2P5HMA2_DIAHE|nr:fungal specific transcription factor domain-containing protein [Diaporthe helianthi]